MQSVDWVSVKYYDCVQVHNILEVDIYFVTRIHKFFFQK